MVVGHIGSFASKLLILLKINASSIISMSKNDAIGFQSLFKNNF